MKEKWDTVASERTNQERNAGRLVTGTYGKDFELDIDGNEIRKVRLVRGRGRPRLDEGELNFTFSPELQALMIAWS